MVIPSSRIRTINTETRKKKNSLCTSDADILTHDPLGVQEVLCIHFINKWVYKVIGQHQRHLRYT